MSDKNVNKVKKILAIAMVFLSVTLLTSCWDKQELDQMAFVLSMGIDRSPAGLLDLTARIAVPEAIVGAGQIGGGAGPTAPGQITKVLTVTARTLPEGVALLEATVERRISFMQCRIVVIDEKLVEEGLHRTIDFFNRHREFRRSLIFFMAKGSPAREIFQHAVPVLEENIARYVEDIVDIQRQFGFSPFVRLHDLNNTMEMYHFDGLIPIMAINEEVAEEKEGEDVKPRPTEEYWQDDEPAHEELKTIPGKLHRSGGNPVSYVGAGVLVGGKLVGFMNADEVRITELLRGRYKTGIWSIPLAQEEMNYASVILDHQRPPLIAVDTSTEPIRITVTIRMKGKLMEVQGQDIGTPEAFRLVEKKIAEALNKKALDVIARMQSIPADPFHFIRPLRWRTLTTKEYVAIPWHEWFQNAEVVVDFQPEVEFFGFQVNPSRPNLKVEEKVLEEPTEEELPGEEEWE
ncbi:Ger(x)C family spore germination protein [Heliorestis acidaminivorans]|uniref:Ger(X)C family spore germination protein n=1 Tax=Heliorestis acidaminivorans TaxID=553427 RepID=A0A6I0F467_9FIRM|nr:Ger(x)C family spore germination protein [Heliorestis acidaminivorans]KAB2954550.1 Ger(x)C family spore germination protein [Heliorestis acidaminivorans]